MDRAADKEFAALKETGVAKDGCTTEEVLASNVYAKFARDRVSKAIAAQYFAERLQTRYENNELTADELRGAIPKYLTNAIDYVTGAKDALDGLPTKPGGTDE